MTIIVCMVNPMNNLRSQMILLFTIVSLLALTITSGCLETPDATPAKVSSEALSKYGWVQIGDVTYETQEEEISGTVIKVNTATIIYQDEQLGQDINVNLQNEISQGHVQTGVQSPTAGSQLITIRIVLPGGIGLPSSVTSKLIGSQITNLAQENNIMNFKKVGTRETNVKDGSSVTANTYSGTITSSDGRNSVSVDVMGVIVPWSGSGSNIIAIGIVPDGDIKVKTELIDLTVITIDGNAEIEEMLELIKTIE